MSLQSCKKGPYHESNDSHDRQLKALHSMLEIPRIYDATDSNQIRDIDIIKTVNFNLRKPNLVVIHHTAQDSCKQTYKTFTDEKYQVSSHYVICKDGTITQMLSDYLRGWHAGRGSWGNITDVNSSSVGIELDNNGNEEFAEAQITSLLSLLGQLKADYKIEASNFIGHADMAPDRKVDPSQYFPWQRLAEHGYGIWYNIEDLEDVPDYFNTKLGLHTLGYSTADLSSAIRAWEIHYSDEETDQQMSEVELRKLYSLYKLKLGK